DFGTVFTDTLEDSMGETIRQIKIGSTNLCETPLSLRLQLAVGRPPRQFSQRAACTLKDVVGNITAFKRDFQNGRWLGLQELAAPQNNRFGLRLLAMEQTLYDSAGRAEVAKTEAIAGQGYKGEKECRQWVRIVFNGDRDIEDVLNMGGVSSETGIPWNDAYFNPQNPPPGNTSDVMQWYCSDPQTTTPASNIKEGGDRLLYSEFERITGSNDLAGRLSAIADAALNRLFAEGARGLLSMVRSEHSTGNPPPPLRHTTPRGEGNLRNATTTYEENQRNIFNQQRRTLLQRIDDALLRTSRDVPVLSGVQTSVNDFIVRVEDLYTCIESCDPPTNMTYTRLWTNTVSSSAWAARTGLVELQGGYWSLASTSAALTALRTGVVAATTLTQLSALNQTSVTAAQTNAGIMDSARNLVEQRSGELFLRRRYCYGEYTPPEPPINACSQIVP
ncbi:MAG: hypothetical protein AAB601_02515, partial [Patescibacteria group bacterium]